MKDSDWQILYELYKTSNITKAADRLYMTQPSLTKRLQSIEEEFQIKIVNRTQKGVEFTEQGEFLAKKAGEYLDFIRCLHRQLRLMDSQEQEIITIGASYTYSKYVLTDILVDYRKTHPQVQFEVQSEQSNLLFRRACDGELDVAFLRGDYQGPVKQRKLGTTRAYIMTREPVELEKLPEMARLDYKTNDRTQELIEGWWQEYYRQPFPPGATSAGYLDVALQMAEGGMGYVLCFLPENYRDTGRLCLTPIEHEDGTPVVRNTWFVYRERKMSEALQEFIRYIEDWVGEENK